MNLQIHNLSLDDYQKKVSSITDRLPLWLQPSLIGCYNNKFILVAVSGDEIKGIWVVPFIDTDGIRMAKREFRFFPYTSPFLTDHDNLKRSEVVLELFKYLTGNCESIYLPMHPEFKDLPVFQSCGAFVEWRHTHILKQALKYEGLNSRLRNHIKMAKSSIEIIISNNPDCFNFDMAIKGGEEERLQRKLSALRLLEQNRAVIISAKKQDNLCAGIMLTYDDQYAYMLHSWQTGEVPRGTISCLIYEAVNWTFNTKYLKYYDFEGSVIHNIDYFFNGFNADIVPYGFLHWSSDKNKLHQLIDRSINIEGRLNPFNIKDDHHD